MKDKFLSISEAAQVLDVSAKTVRENLDEWGIPHVRLGKRIIRILFSSLIRWGQENEAKTQQAKEQQERIIKDILNKTGSGKRGKR